MNRKTRANVKAEGSASLPNFDDELLLQDKQRVLNGRSDSAHDDFEGVLSKTNMLNDALASDDGEIVLDTKVATEYLLQSNDVAQVTQATDEEFSLQSIDDQDILVSGDVVSGSRGNDKEWNSKFLKRWKAVKRQARLQALGMRPQWRSESNQSFDNELPELLVNEMPEQRRQNSGKASNSDQMNRNPSLATLLRGEAPEIC